MINKILSKVFGSQHERDVKRLQPLVEQINALEPQVKPLSDDELRAKTDEFRARFADGESLDDLLPEAFAVCREAALRSVGMRHYDVQLIGGVVLHQGQIAEMKTGEGKTLVATMPVYLNTLSGKGVHLVTVNDYLARRDAEWMGQVYRFLGLTVGVIQHDMPDADRKAAYTADVTYGTNNEFGFDYLRDNMKFDLESRVQRHHSFAVVDEVDSVLIDEARTPLIISGPSESNPDKYYKLNGIIPHLEQGEEVEHEDGTKETTGDFVIDEKAKAASLTDEGVAKVEKLLGLENLYDPANMDSLHGVNQALRAHHLYKHDVDYLVLDGKVVIVDEFTGRMMSGRRWSDGLHQAVEAKEGVQIEKESQTLATITLQNYFRLYDKLAGMTGTADTEAAEFNQIYKLDVVVIPTNRPIGRDDRADLVYRTGEEKWVAVVEDIEACHAKGQPVLVGTISIETSEMMSRLLKRKRIPHVVLNAKFHGREASIIAQAGRKGSVTIATNMAGRGTDIVLGGNPEGLARSEADPETETEEYQAALERYQASCIAEREEVLTAGGLHILGTERHESRRIDNQLRGRSGRQGDAGSSRFFLSLDDDLMRIFVGADRLKGILSKLGMEQGEPIEHRMVSKAIERAQTQVEGQHFGVRKHLLEYDDVMNRQRTEVYALRRGILAGQEGREYLTGITNDVIEYLVGECCPEKADPMDWDLTRLTTEFLKLFAIDLNEQDRDLTELGIEELQEYLVGLTAQRTSARDEEFGRERMEAVHRHILLREVDGAWKDHLLSLDHLKEGIGLRGYGQKNPLDEYKRESYELFQEMKENIEDNVLQKAYRLEPISEEEFQEMVRRQAAQRAAALSNYKTNEGNKPPSGPTPNAGVVAPSQLKPQAPAGPPRGPATVVNTGPKVGRNDPCWCGSGKKFKKCHGAAVPVG